MKIRKDRFLKKDAVELRYFHSYLESKTAFSSFVQKLIWNPEFKSGVDYTRVKKIKGNLKINYFISIQCARRVAVLEESTRGDEVCLEIMQKYLKGK